MNTQSFLSLFRQIAPYIHSHRGKTFVIYFEADFSDENLNPLLHDCALLHSLGIRLILSYGMRKQIEKNLTQQNIASKFHNSHRLTDKQTLPAILSAAGKLRLKIEATLSMSMMNSPMQDASIRTSSGNFITARPIGILEGIDHGYTGTIRKIHHESIKTHLDNGEIVIISPIGYSASGDTYNLSSDETASSIARAIKADKLIYISDHIAKTRATLKLHQLSPQKAEELAQHIDDTFLKQRMLHAAEACKGGIARVHLIERQIEGALLQELFTRDGTGIMINADDYDELRQATTDDIHHIITLIKPLEEKGILIPRSRESLEKDIQNFYLLIRDQSIIACAALYPYPEEKTAELACLAVAPEYRKHRRADYLLQSLENIARQKGLKSLFLLTTQTAQWFEEHGFSAIEIHALPEKKQKNYNPTRNSRPYLKPL